MQNMLYSVTSPAGGGANPVSLINQTRAETGNAKAGITEVEYAKVNFYRG